MVGFHYFLLELTSHLQSITALWPVPDYTLWWLRHVCVNNLPSHYSKVKQSPVEPATSWLWIWCPLQHHATQNTLVAWRVALAWHPRMHPLQAGSNSAPMSARQGPLDWLLHISIRHCQQNIASRHHLTVPRHRLSTLGCRAFSVAGPMVWNSLPDSLHDPALSNDRFRQLLKTNLFRHYHWVHTAQ